MRPLALALLLTACGNSDTRDTDAPSGSASTTGSATPLPYTAPDSFEVLAATYWVNTQRYLRAGDQLTLSATGQWTMWDGVYDAAGPEGADWDLWGCPAHSLVGSVGLHWEDAPLCIGAGATITAPHDGILYLAANDGGREDNAGSVTVTIEGEAEISPIVAAADVPGFPWDAVTANDVEIRGTHVWLEVPTSLAAQFRDDATDSLAMFDTWYGHHTDLADQTPYGGQPIRFVPDASIADIGAWMLSGNPIRIDPDAQADSGAGSHVLLAHDPGHSAWGFVHEMGHDFSFINGGAYMIGGGPVEAWANVWSRYTLEQVGFPEADRAECDGVADYQASGVYSDFEEDAWIPLCMLMEIRDDHGGWDTYASFFAAYNALPDNAIPTGSDPIEDRWGFVRDQLNAAAGSDITPILQAYHIPLP